MANPEHLKILKRGVEAWNRWRKENPEIRPDLKAANLRQKNLYIPAPVPYGRPIPGLYAGIDFRQADLIGADFQMADLRKAKLNEARLSNADLSAVNFSGAVLCEADLSEADLRNSWFDGADLRAAVLRMCRISGATFKGVDFRGTNMSGLDLAESCLRRARLEGADLYHRELRGADLSEANLSGADLRKSDLTKTILRRANLEGADLRGVDLRGCYLEGARFTRANLEGANLSALDLRFSIFENAYLDAAILEGANLQRVVLDRAKLRKARLRRADLLDARLAGTDLSESDLREADLQVSSLEGANLRRADLRGAIVANPSDYRTVNLLGREVRVDETVELRYITRSYLHLATARNIDSAYFDTKEFLPSYIDRAFEYVHRPDIAEASGSDVAAMLYGKKVITRALQQIQLLRRLYRDTDEPPGDLVEAIKVITGEVIQYLAKHPQEIYRVRPRQFEELIAEILAGYGWEVNLTPTTRDGGYDLLAVSRDVSGVKTSWIIECKRYRRDRKVGIDVVRGLYGVKLDLKVANMLLATTSYFSRDVHAYKASRYDLELRDYEGILEWLNEYRPNPNGRLYIKDHQLVVPDQS